MMVKHWTKFPGRALPAESRDLVTAAPVGLARPQAGTGNVPAWRGSESHTADHSRPESLAA